MGSRAADGAATIDGGTAGARAPELGMIGSPHWARASAGSRPWTRLANLLRRVAVRSSTVCRQQRARLFLDRLRPGAADRILDLGGGKGGYMAEILSHRANVTIADVDPGMLRIAAESYGFGTLRLDGAARLPIADGAYDIVFSSSVIEHITGPHETVCKMTDGLVFAASARVAQARFAAELRRVGKRYFVQTPYKYFPLEPHSFLPFVIVLLPRRWQVALLAFCGRHWIKSVQPDFRLLTIREMRALFPDAEIVLERYCGFVKSIVAIKA